MADTFDPVQASQDLPSQPRFLGQLLSQSVDQPQPPPQPDIEQAASGGPQQMGQQLQAQQNQPQPQQPQPEQDQQNPFEQVLKDQYQRYQAAAVPSAQGGQVKRLLSNFVGAMSHGLMPITQSPEFERQRALTNIMNLSAAQGNLDLHKQMIQTAALKNATVSQEQASQLGYEELAGRPWPEALQYVAGIQKADTAAKARVDAAETGTHRTISVPGVGAFAWDPNSQGYKPIQGGQVPQHILQPGEAEQLGFPTGTTQVPEATYSQAVGAATKPLATVQGADDQYQYNRLTGQKTALGVGNPRIAAAQAGAQARAAVTPFETTIPGTNIPTTISNLQAVRQGLPKVPLGTQAKLGGQYALFNDAYGILDKIDQSVGTGKGQVNLEDPAVRARVTAGYSALKDPQVTGLVAHMAGPMASEFLSNYLGRQQVNSSLKPEEREFILNMAQGKAAATGLRGILGQAGTNEMQQRLDSAMFPGAQAAGSIAGIKQQTQAMRGLLGRVSVGQPKVGLNAPGTPTALPSANSPQNANAGTFSVPAGAPHAPVQDGNYLKVNGQRVAVSKGGQWVQIQ